MVATDNRDVLQRLKRCGQLSGEIETQCRMLEAQLGNVRSDVMDDLKPYINPKKNIDALCSFYDLFSTSKERIDLGKERLRSLFGEEEGPLPSRSLEALKENRVLEEVLDLIREKDTLSGYANIRMAKTELEHTEDFTGKVLEAVSSSFFIALDRLPQQDPHLREFAVFLLENTHRKRFLAAYTDKVYTKLGIEDIGASRRLLLERIRNLGAYFSDVADMNDSILGAENARALNLGLFKTFVLELKKVVVDVLMVIEREEGAEDIPFLIQLNAALRHSEHGFNELIEELFEFKDNINKILHNCLLVYFEKVDCMSEPNKHSDAEEACSEMAKILDAFHYEKEVGEAFASSYGAVFNVRNLQDIFSEFSARVIRKVLLLSEMKRGVSKSVYVVNNVYVLRSYLKEVNGAPAGDFLSGNVDSIIDVWEKEMSKRKEKDVTEFLDQNVRLQQKHSLPAGLREGVIERIEELVEDMLRRKEYRGDRGRLMDAVQTLYSAK
jgi:hypothetical protein